jgi:hypothetical protein
VNKNRVALSAYVLLVLLAAACSQNAIFHTIAQEVKPLEPRIKNPTNMAILQRADGKKILYVGSGSSLYWYTSEGWNSDDSPGGNIEDIASANGALYVITDSGLYALPAGASAWQEITVPDDAGTLQTIFTSNGRVFVGTGGDPYDIYELSGTMSLIGSGTGMLTGAAYNGVTIYLSTTKNLYKLNPGLDVVYGNHYFTGIISLENGSPAQLATIDIDGKLFEVKPAGEVEQRQNMDTYAQRSLCLWREPQRVNQDRNAPYQLLLAGMQDSLTNAYTYGYREFKLNYDTAPRTYTFGAHTEPGTGSPSSVADNSQYVSSIGKHAVYHLLQVPYEIDPAMPLFAATTSSLWSYRNRDGTPQWNAED